MPRLPKPEPVVTSTVCSVCDLPWEDHGDEPTLLDCIRLLKDRPTPIQWYPYTPSYPQWTPTITYGTTTTDNVVYIGAGGATVGTIEDDPPDDAVPAAV